MFLKQRLVIGVDIIKIVMGQVKIREEAKASKSRGNVLEVADRTG